MSMNRQDTMFCLFFGLGCMLYNTIDDQPVVTANNARFYISSVSAYLATVYTIPHLSAQNGILAFFIGMLVFMLTLALTTILMLFFLPA